MTAWFAELLPREHVQRVHEASLDILERVGVLVRNQRAGSLFGHLHRPQEVWTTAQ